MNAMRCCLVAAVGMIAACGGDHGREPDPGLDATETSGPASTTMPGGTTSDSGASESDSDSDGGGTGAPEPGGVGPAEYPHGRRIRRMSAEQYVASLEVATGQVWPDAAEFIHAMGKPDYAQTTDQDLSLSVTFEKFSADAAVYACRAAVEADLAGGDTILRRVAADDDDETSIRLNLQYLFLRFLGNSLETDDPELEPWVNLVKTASAAEAAERWVAVCVGLATHPDFVAY